MAKLGFWLQLAVIFASILVLGWGFPLKGIVGGGMVAMMMLYIIALQKKWTAFNSNVGLNALGALAGVVGIIALVQ